MEEKDFKVKHSLRTRILLSFFIIIGGTITLLMFFNSVFADSFYRKSIISNMRSSFNDINLIINDYSSGKINYNELSNRMEKMTQEKDVNVIILESDWSTFYTNVHDDKFIRERIVTSILDGGPMGPTLKAVDTVEIRNDYTIQSIYDDGLETYVYELFGTYQNGYTAMIRRSTADIESFIKTVNLIDLIAGIIAIASAVLGAIIISGLVVRPLRKLTQISEQMSRLDFNVSYENKDRSEVGMLGNSMNKLSKQLEESIKQLKTANLELTKNIAEKEKAQVRQKEFLSNVSHELKTPLALITGYAEALKEGLADDKETMDEYCDIISDEAGKMDILVKQLLTINELESGGLNLDIECFSISDIISSILNSYMLQIEKKEINVDFKQADECIKAWGDELRIEQVCTNYITNALNHCPAHGKIKIWIDKEPKKAKVHVWNSGSHISKEHIDEIWDKFYKIDKARTRKYGGNGIGLSIVKAIMEMHGCAYGALNSDDGVDFWFELDCDRGTV